MYRLNKNTFNFLWDLFLSRSALILPGLLAEIASGNNLALCIHYADVNKEFIIIN